jgi:hypothetical protein
MTVRGINFERMIVNVACLWDYDMYTGIYMDLIRARSWSLKCWRIIYHFDIEAIGCFSVRIADIN